MGLADEIDGIAVEFYLFILRILEFVTVGQYEQKSFRPKGRVAIIGAGRSGTTAACYCISSGFDVTIWESTPYIGGQWRLNADNELYCLQHIPPINCASFHPVSVLESIRCLYNRYNLHIRTRFNTPVQSIGRSRASDLARDGHNKWIINDVQAEVFDAVICATGSYEQWDMSGLDGYGGKIITTRQFQSMKGLEGLKVVIVGDGIEAANTLEKVLEKMPTSLALIGPDRKWIIPKYYTVAILQTLLPGRIRCEISKRTNPTIKDWFFYSCLSDFSDKKLNSSYSRSVPSKLEIHKSQIRHSNDLILYLSDEATVEADLVILTTPVNMSKTPTVPPDLHHSPLFLSSFPQKDICVLYLPSSSFQLALSTRLLLLFLSMPETIPSPLELKKWVEWTESLPWLLKLLCFLVLHPFRIFWVWEIVGRIKELIKRSRALEDTVVAQENPKLENEILPLVHDGQANEHRGIRSGKFVEEDVYKVVRIVSESKIQDRLCFDLHLRDGKYGHADHFPLNSGYVDETGNRVRPISALVCNFSKLHDLSRMSADR
ncbi:Dimethylaniline monooxygenase [N-oxide-forming] 2 [Neolecta irregularis DAH-3]|uniref:Dimethylaniline monooxygenase [N-oxide-forming] 2 n=1 Tax=Neolecta irregularis (strain DAH-3) TaxID=1198029 RepID=A0A1U7LVI4_NEOID|nr:Dimethylaniline monooxygenase [N-oxide-forming] 2 [Neolecta irregularis DAH-3]|eukprot:OLL26583.1 Dimethylaniline monooxygenase [N-oxide-forming] 2 [Neolecta irregularis DAH-3]